MHDCLHATPVPQSLPITTHCMTQKPPIPSMMTSIFPRVLLSTLPTCSPLLVPPVHNNPATGLVSSSHSFFPVRISARWSAALKSYHPPHRNTFFSLKVTHPTRQFLNRNMNNFITIQTQDPAPVLTSVPAEHGLLRMALFNVRSLSNKTFI